MAGQREVPTIGLKHTSGMELSLGRDVCGVRIFRGSENSQVLPHPGGFYGCHPLFAAAGVDPIGRVPRDAEKAAAISRIPMPHVLSIDAAANIAKIAYPVICPVPVDMVYFPKRPIAVLDKPCESVGVSWYTVNRYGDVAKVLAQGAGCGAGFGAATPVNIPYKFAGFFVVAKKFAYKFCGKIIVSHKALLLLVGQRLVCVGSVIQASLFSHRMMAEANCGG